MGRNRGTNNPEGGGMFIRPSQNQFQVVERVDDKNELILRTLDTYKEAEAWIEQATKR